MKAFIIGALLMAVPAVAGEGGRPLGVFVQERPALPPRGVARLPFPEDGVVCYALLSHGEYLSVSCVKVKP